MGEMNVLVKIQVVQIWVYRFNSEFGMRNSELREDERFNRYFASAFFLKALVINAF